MKRISSNNCLVLMSAILATNLVMPGVFGQAVAQDPSAITPPPVARVRPVVNDYFGTKVTDPYRYMESLDNPEVAGWMKAQNEYTRRVLGRIPGRAELLARIEQLDESIPARVGEIVPLATGRYFYLKSLSKDSVFKLYMRDGASGPERLLVDPHRRSGVGPPDAINFFWPSNDGRYIAYGISQGGSEKAVLHILDTTTARDTGESIDRVQFGEVIGWLPDARSFIYNRLRKLPANAQEEDKEIKSRAYLHIVGTSPEHDNPVFGYGVSSIVKVEPADLSFVATFSDVPFAFGTLLHGSQNELTLYVAPIASIGKQNTPWRKIYDVDDDVTNLAVRGDDLWLLTHKNASRFKIIHTRLSNPDLSQADVVVPPSEAVITNLAAAQDALYVELRDGAVDRLVRIGYEAGSKPEPVTLPFEGSIGLYPTDVRAPGVVFALTGWTRAERIYEYDPRTKSVTDTRLRPTGPFDTPEDIESEEVKVRGQDGTLVPLSIIYRRGLRLDGSNPVLLNGYGAYGSSLDPFFDPTSLAWLEQGGVLAFAHVRGGGEYGNDWHTAGQKLTKPNTWHDFIACAKYLVEKKYTSPEHLAGEGASAGGILIGRAITERPDLFGAALIEVGFTDALRGELEESGPGDIPEWGTVKEPDGFKGLYEMSAYTLVKRIRTTREATTRIRGATISTESTNLVDSSPATGWKSMQKNLILIAAITVFAAAAQAKDQPELTVEVLQAETVHWTTYWHDNGSAGTTTTNCDLYDTSASCTSTTQGARPASTTPIYHTQVNLLVKMPDGNTVPMQCHYPPVWATCFEPQLTTYAAKINGHNIHLLIPVVTGKPKYNKDGTLKKPGKTGTEEVKFSFR